MKAVIALLITSLTLAGLSVYMQTHGMIDIMQISTLEMMGLGAAAMLAAAVRAAWILEAVDDTDTPKQPFDDMCKINECYQDIADIIIGGTHADEQLKLIAAKNEAIGKITAEYV